MPLSWKFHQLKSLAIVGCLLAAGCSQSKPTGRLTGRVTFEGNPVADATIQVKSPTSGYADAAILNDNGEFRFASPLSLGEYAVSIMPTVKAHDPGSGTTVAPPSRPDIPSPYRAGGTSGVKVVVTTGNNSLDVELTKAN